LPDKFFPNRKNPQHASSSKRIQKQNKTPKKNLKNKQKKITPRSRECYEVSVLFRGQKLN
jgi:hypothetical protein